MPKKVLGPKIVWVRRPVRIMFLNIIAGSLLLLFAQNDSKTQIYLRVVTLAQTLFLQLTKLQLLWFHMGFYRVWDRIPHDKTP